jgi:hypothetical protein
MMANRFRPAASCPLDVGAFQAHHHRHRDADLLDRVDDALGDQSQRTMPPKMLTRMALTLSIGQDQLEGLLDALGVGAAADIEEVGRRTAASLITSMVAIARPAPLTMQAMLPSRVT